MADGMKQHRSTESGPTIPCVKTVACVGGVSLERGVPTEEIHDYIKEARNLVWVDVQDPGPEELSMLVEEFGFHPLALDDATKGQQRPKVDEYKGHLFAVMYGVAAGPELKELQTVEVGFFIGRNYVVSIHRGRVTALEEGLARWTRGGAMMREGVGFLVYTLMDALIDTYFPIIDAIERQIEEIELGLLGPFRGEAVHDLLKLKRSLVALRRVLYPLREAFHIFLRPDHSYFSAGTLVYFQDVYDHILRILDALDIERDMLSAALDAQLTLMSHRLNETLKTLAILTVAIAILSAAFGAWGMNFDAIPLARVPWGFPAVVLGTLALLAVLGVLNWRYRWM
jgi:magnesium transporter